MPNILYNKIGDKMNVVDKAKEFAIKAHDGQVRKTEKDKPKVVYITKSGKKYHYSKSCGKRNYKAVSLSEAVKKGYEPCKKCAK